MRHLLCFVALVLLVVAGCKPSTNTATTGADDDPVVENGGNGVTPPKSGGDDIVKEEDLPENPARDVSEEQKKVDAMDIDALIVALGDDKLYDVAAEELKTRGPEAVEPLTAALDSGDADARQSAIFALGRLEKHAAPALPKLREIAKDDNQPEEVIDSARFAIDAIEGK